MALTGDKIYLKLLLTVLIAILNNGLVIFSQENVVVVFEVDPDGFQRENSIVGTSLEGHKINGPVFSLELFEVTGGKEVYVESQIDNSGEAKLWWILDGITSINSIRKYELRKVEKKEASPPTATFNKDDKKLNIQILGENVIQYNHAIVPPPEGVNKIYERGGFIHPIWSPSGEELTRIHPPDHHHHMGLWNPWTLTEFEGREIDFWNLYKAQGTVKFNSFISTTNGLIYGGFRAIHDHVDLNASTPEGSSVVMKEEWDVRVWDVGKENDNVRLIDFNSTLNGNTDKPLTIKEYRYQGFGFRGTEKWNDETCTILTSEGYDKTTGNATRARWCDIRGISEFGTSGILFLTHPSNYNFPEPIRIWPTGSNEGEANVFFNFNPAMDCDWIIEPGKDYKLRYRMYVYDGEIDAQLAEKIWIDYAHPPVVKKIK